MTSYHQFTMITVKHLHLPSLNFLYLVYSVFWRIMLKNVLFILYCTVNLLIQFYTLNIFAFKCSILNLALSSNIALAVLSKLKCRRTTKEKFLECAKAGSISTSILVMLQSCFIPLWITSRLCQCDTCLPSERVRGLKWIYEKPHWPESVHHRFTLQQQLWISCWLLRVF